MLQFCGTIQSGKIDGGGIYLHTDFEKNLYTLVEGHYDNRNVLKALHLLKSEHFSVQLRTAECIPGSHSLRGLGSGAGTPPWLGVGRGVRSVCRGHHVRLLSSNQKISYFQTASGTLGCGWQLDRFQELFIKVCANISALPQSIVRFIKNKGRDLFGVETRRDVKNRY